MVACNSEQRQLCRSFLYFAHVHFDQNVPCRILFAALCLGSYGYEAPESMSMQQHTCSHALFVVRFIECCVVRLVVGWKVKRLEFLSITSFDGTTLRADVSLPVTSTAEKFPVSWP